MYKNILIPVALDHEHDIGNAIDIARRLQDKDGKLTALHVIEGIPQFAAVYLPEDYREKQHSAALALMKTELGAAADVFTDVVTGHAGRSIHEYAEKHAADCIIVASHRPGFKDHFLGSTAAWVVRHSSCAVHVLK
ncbi:universal stress protein [Granulosicoccus sp. 3-233]|uniref:universal stress protein n=1 Tax=Granulosicoccus sp. 3-233 TaxID=3417969 RepID=UPI003D32A5F8